MTRDDLHRLVAEVQQRQSELDDVEVKTARGGTPKRLYEGLSAFANRPGGGVLLFGLDEAQRFATVGVGDPHRLQEEVSHLCTTDMEPALRPTFTVDEIEDHPVIAVEVAEVPTAHKPCFYKTAGLPKGAYLRVGNTNRQMTEYEVFGYLSSRGQPTCDEETINGATLDDLDDRALDSYLDELRRTRPRAAFLRDPHEESLIRLQVVRRVEGHLRPTLAGLLMFGKYPQQFLPQLMITFLQYYGTTEEEKTPQGERFMDNRRFEGPIPEMVAEAETYVMGAMRKASLIEGVVRRDIPEYPREAMREAIVNAVAHRDYSPYVRGSYVQIRMFADRIEIQSPGGLFGNVTVENMDEEQSTRNARLMRMMEDAHIVENRGSGIRAMLDALRGANLEPPRFEDRRSSFLVTFRNHTLMNPEAIAWLNRFAHLSLNDRQRVALVYLRQHGQINNSEYQRLNRVNTVVAGQELRGLVQSGLIEPRGFGRWTSYTMKPLAEPAAAENAVATQEARVLDHVRIAGSITNAECRRLLGINADRAKYLLRTMTRANRLKADGSGRWKRYLLP